MGEFWTDGGSRLDVISWVGDGLGLVSGWLFGALVRGRGGWCKVFLVRCMFSMGFWRIMETQVWARGIGAFECSSSMWPDESGADLFEFHTSDFMKVDVQLNWEWKGLSLAMAYLHHHLWRLNPSGF